MDEAAQVWKAAPCRHQAMESASETTAATAYAAKTTAAAENATGPIGSIGDQLS